MKFRFDKKLKRIADVMEKLGVAGVALAIYQNNREYVWFGILSLLISLLLTKED